MQLSTSTEKDGETFVSAPPLVVTETAICVVAMPIVVSTVIVPLGLILIPLTEGIIEYEVKSTAQFDCDEEVEVTIVGKLLPRIVV